VNLSLFKSFATLSVAETVSKVLTFAAFAYLARVFGPSGFGYIEWSAAILMCASLMVDQGFNSYGAREIARDRKRTAALVSEIVTARYLLAGISYTGIIAFTYLFVNDKAVRDLILIYGLSLWLLPILLQWVFQGYERMGLVALTQVVRQVVFFVAVVVLVRSTGDITFVGWAETAAVVTASLVSLWLYKRYIGAEAGFRPVLSRELFRSGIPIGIGQMFWVVRMFGATLIVGLVATAEDTGYFAGAMRIFIALHTFVWLYFFNLLPSMSRAWIEGRAAFAALTSRSIRMVALACAAVGAAWVALSSFAMTTAYGPEFLTGVPVLQWLAGAWIAAAVSGHFRFGLIAAGRQFREMASSSIGAGATLVMVPFGYLEWGVAGAGAALFAAELLVLISSWAFARPLFRSEPPVRRIAADETTVSIA
jgi:O-antigen/teichoic acid export membrane protein